MDAPDHTRQRRVRQREFTAKQAQSLKPFIDDIVDGLLDGMQASGGPVDLPVTW
jgi:cytochrome P450